MKILMTMFGWNDVGGGTSYPRQFAVDLVRLGHEVTVFYAAVHDTIPQQAPKSHTLLRHEEEGVQLIKVQDRPSLFLDTQHPEREVCYPPIVESFERILYEFKPDIIHFQNFLGLSIGLTEVAYRAGVPSLFSAHNFWLLCPTLYLLLPNGQVCSGIDTQGENCKNCCKNVQNPWEKPLYPDASAYLSRHQDIKTQFASNISRGLVNSHRVKEIFVQQGYNAQHIQVQKLSNPRCQSIWNEIGQFKSGETSDPIRIAYMGQVVHIKGVHILIQAIQELQGDFEVHIYGVANPHYLQWLMDLDQKNRAIFHGEFDATTQKELLREIDLGIMSSICLDHSPLVISEFLSARVPVISADIGGARDYIQEQACVLYDPENSAQLSAILQNLISHPQKIREMKSQIQAPWPADMYLHDLLKHYQDLLSHDEDLFMQRIQRFAQQRKAQNSKYNASTLWPDAQAHEYGLDLHDIKSWHSYNTLELKNASWIISPNHALTQEFTAQGITATHAPLLHLDQPKHINLTVENANTILVPMDTDHHWKVFLQTFIAHPSLNFIPLFLPWQINADQAQDLLIQSLEDLNIELDQAPEMILLEEENIDFFPSVFKQAQFCYLASSTIQNELTSLARECEGLISKTLNPDLSALFQASKNSFWSESSAKLGLKFFERTHTIDEHNQLIVKNLKSAIIKTD